MWEWHQFSDLPLRFYYQNFHERLDDYVWCRAISGHPWWPGWWLLEVVR